MLVRDFISNRKRGEDSQETERECVLEAEHCREREMALAIK